MQDNWSPTARLLVGATGCGLMAYCGTKRDPLSLSLGTVGFAMLMRSLTNREMKQIISMGRGDRDSGSQATDSPDAMGQSANVAEKRKTAQQGNNF
jgi:hypothetical protein